jgi:rod shape determining protein RodA
MRNYGNVFRELDYTTLLLWVLIMFLGWLNIYSAVFDPEYASILDMNQRYGKQLLWILTALGIMFLVLLIDSSVFYTLAYPVYGLSLLSLVLVLFLGAEISGARSWFVIGGFSLQPSEFAKAATALALARFLSGYQRDLRRFSHQLMALGLAFLPALLIVPQPDLGSVLVYTAFILVLYREGLPSLYLVIGFALILVFVLSLLVPLPYLYGGLGFLTILLLVLGRRQRGNGWKVLGVMVLCGLTVQSVDFTFNNLLEDRHRNRINILLGKAEDPQGIGYNTHQSMIAIGSGGLKGKGYMEGTQTKYDFVPEQSTDFIFCTVGEEWGFLGTSALVLLYLVLFFRLMIVAERQRSSFARAYGYGVLCILFLHFGINIAMTIGLAPVIGIPLPFFSYGGSSLWGFTLLLAIFLRLDAGRTLSL